MVKPLHQMTDDEKRALFNEFAAVPNSKRQRWIKAHTKLSPPHFYKARKAFLGAATPPPIRQQPAARLAAREPASRSVDFRSADEATKRQLVAEYDAIPRADTQQRSSWLMAHGMSPSRHNRDRALITYYRGVFSKKDGVPLQSPKKPKHISADGRVRIAEAQRRRWAKAKAAGLTGKSTRRPAASVPSPSTALVPASFSPDAALLAEYDALPKVPGQKSAWLKEKGLNYQNIFDMRRCIAMNVVSSQPTKAAALAQVLPAAAPGPIITLEDAINAEQVRIDITLEVLDRLRRMLRSGK